MQYEKKQSKLNWFFKAALAITMALGVQWGANASPLSAGVKVAGKGIAKIAEKIGLKAAGRAAVRGGAEFAAAKAARTAAKAARAAAKAGKAAKGLSGSQILAAGGAAAMVTGAHEVADGIQTACEQTGEALKNNPGKAAMVAGGLTWTMGIAWALMALAAGGLVIWMFFPLASALRTRWSASNGNAAGATSAVSTTVAGTHAGYVRVWALFAMAAFAVLTILGIARYVQNQSEVDPSGETGGGNPNRAALQKHLNTCKSEYELAVKRRYQEFEKGIDGLVREQYDAVYGKVPAVAARYGSIGRLAHLVKTMVVDKLAKQNETANEVEADLQSCFYPALYAAYDASMESCQRLQADLASERAKYIGAVKSIALELGEASDDEYMRRIETSAVKIDAVQQRLFSAQSDAALAVVLEAVCVRTTLATLSKLLAKTVSRQVATVLASLGCACADGPLPVGEILGALATAGCTVWTGYDVYVATKKMPAALESTLRSAVDDCRKSALKAVRERADALFMAYAKGK